jgi:hypothetical protein
MSRKPTADELRKVFTKLDLELAETAGAYATEFAELKAAIDGALEFRSETLAPLVVKFKMRKQYADKRLKKMEKELIKVRKKCWKLYGIAL